MSLPYQVCWNTTFQNIEDGLNVGIVIGILIIICWREIISMKDLLGGY